MCVFFLWTFTLLICVLSRFEQVESLPLTTHLRGTKTEFTFYVDSTKDVPKNLSDSGFIMTLLITLSHEIPNQKKEGKAEKGQRVKRRNSIKLLFVIFFFDRRMFGNISRDENLSWIRTLFDFIKLRIRKNDS